MKKKSIVLQLRKFKIANFHTIYAGGTNTCTTDDIPQPPQTDDCSNNCTDKCTSSIGGEMDSISRTDTKP